MTAFPSIDAATRGRLEARGIDPDESLRRFLAEVRELPPSPLLAVLFGPARPDLRKLSRCPMGAPLPKSAADKVVTT